MMGISPDVEKPGFMHFILSPNPDRRLTLRYSQQRITLADASFWSPYGMVKAAWQCDGGSEMIYKVVVPANTTATLIMLIDEGYTLYEGGASLLARCRE